MHYASANPPGAGLHPIEVLVDSLIVAGHAQNLMRLVSGAFDYHLDRRDQRIRMIAMMYVRHLTDYYTSLEYVLPLDPPSAIYKLSVFKNSSLVNPADIQEYNSEDPEKSAQMAMASAGLRVAPPRDTCCRALRRQPLSVSTDVPCSLEREIVGGVAVPGTWQACNVTTYGLTAAASQVWSIVHLLPNYPRWTFGDEYGAIGIILGHIFDTSTRRELSTRITNRHVALY
ncbi:hypothetical protein Pmani_001002 [Petrolisthes manimaculis]|uniref:Uncharacterized protein n=1 Tax=Petrolisthes manimaculis TaxID=1843537 RepID=A0AAE1QL83_9EUCA|nr:hypothetical protein Pmani_001002 [Petrolisthes manimaculis]